MMRVLASERVKKPLRTAGNGEETRYASAYKIGYNGEENRSGIVDLNRIEAIRFFYCKLQSFHFLRILI